VDIALLVHGRKDVGPVRNALLRPFASSSLYEIALEKLSNLDAPCRKLVAVGDRELKQAAAQFSGLTLLRQDAADAPGAANEFGYLAKAPESWFLVINPLYPLVTGEAWWEAVESFLADEPHVWASAGRVEGIFFDVDGTPCAAEAAPQAFLQVNGAFRIVSKASLLERGARDLLAHATPFTLPKTACCGIHEMEDLTSTEAVYSMSQLGIFA
jgi:CMP-N-acetylneuraminic acid synthetase